MTETKSNKRKKTVFAITIAAVAALGLTACGSDSGALKGSGASSSPVINAADFTSIVAAGKTAPDDVIAKSAWAKKIKDAGVLKLAGTNTNAIFSLLNPKTNKLEGFDAGISQLLAKYILGDSSKIQFTQATTETRETLLQNNTVDVVIATYSITAPREQKVGFAGPYFVGSLGVLSKTGESYKSLADLKGKKIVTQAASNNIDILKNAGYTDVQTFTNSADCATAVLQGRADVYVNGIGLVLAQAAKTPDQLAVSDLGQASDPYGIGVNKDSKSDSIAFLNDFLKSIEADGGWANLWKNSIGKYLKGDVPTPPALSQKP